MRNINYSISELFFKYILRRYENPKISVSLDKMSESSSNITAEAVLRLTTRLAKAEHRLKVLTCEIKTIKEDLTSIQQNPSTSIRQFSASIRRPATEIDGQSSSSSTNGVGESKRPRYDNFTTENDYVVVFTDGACENNGSPNAKAGIGIWFGYNNPLNVSQPLTGKATNNRAEITACLEAILIAHKNGIKKLKIKTDSRLVVEAMKTWMVNWKKNNWKAANKKDVKNKEDFVKLDNACNLLDDIQWEHVRGHSGVIGNVEADKLATAGAVYYK